MAQFRATLPDAVVKEFKKIHDNTEQIFGEMTRAGAEVAKNNVIANIPNKDLVDYVKTTRTYKTPTDGGINTKVYISGYLPFRGNRKGFARRGRKGGQIYVTDKGVPADFVAMIYEYGRSDRPFPKKPFLRRSFNSGSITEAMLEAQRNASGGLLE